MFRKHLSARSVTVVTILLLAVVQYTYWRLLVYEPPAPPGPPMGGGGAAPGPRLALGRQDVTVDTFAGGAPGLRDGAIWQARFSGPNAVALGPDGSLWITDSGNHRVRRISPDRKVSTAAGGGEPGGLGSRADGPAAAARFRYPSGVAAAPDGVIYVADTGNHRICQIRDGQVSTLAGGAAGKADGPGTTARFQLPAALTLHTDGALWVLDAGNRATRRVGRDGQVTSPASIPAPVAEALGDMPGQPRPVVIAAGTEGRGSFEPTEFSLGARSAGAANGGVRIYADTVHHVLMAARPGEPALLIAGRRMPNPAAAAVSDGEGHRASFALPCAVATAGDAAYVADYEGHCIRRLRLPAWLINGEAPPTERRRGRWRF